MLWLSQRLFGMPAQFWRMMEWAMAVVALVIAVLAFAIRRSDRVSHWCRVLGISGGCLVALGMFTAGHGLSVRGSLAVGAGGALLVLAHMLNLRVRR